METWPYQGANSALCNVQDLEKSYCPPLDPALFTAIVSDFDLADQNQVQQLRDTLDALKLSAWEQEDLPFDPSGTSGLGPGTGLDAADGILSDRSRSGNGTSQSRDTDLTSLASDLSSLSVGDRNSRRHGSSGCSSSSSGGRIGYVVSPDGSVGLSGASLEHKIQYLTEMFPSVDAFTIRHTLGKCHEDVDRSMDLLLNLSFFDEQGSTGDGLKLAMARGIDGFEENSLGNGRSKKGKRRKAKNRVQDLSEIVDCTSPEPSSASDGVNKWNAAQQDVEFIHARTSSVLKAETVRSTYHANGASLSATVQCLAVSHAPSNENLLNEDPVMVSQVAELSQEFSTIPPLTLAGLLNISRNSISAAHELATAMTARPLQPVRPSDIIQIKAPAIAPDSTIENTSRTTAIAPSPRGFDTTRVSAGSHFLASSEAFSKASMAYKRSKSDRLMGGAAAYYSAVARDHLERGKRETSAAADALVDSQSTSTMLDLHGVSVQDAVRIASQRVSAWWESLGDSKYIRGGIGPAREGYRIVTGVGRHSHDGASRLGPAVGKMLARQGWRVEVGEGVLTVTGVARKR